MRIYDSSDYSRIDEIMSDLDMDTTTNDSNLELNDYEIEYYEENSMGGFG